MNAELPGLEISPPVGQRKILKTFNPASLSLVDFNGGKTPSSEMEFLDINLPNDLRVFCSMLFPVPSTGGF
jgi:hypothetical protein